MCWAWNACDMEYQQQNINNNNNKNYDWNISNKIKFHINLLTVV